MTQLHLTLLNATYIKPVSQRFHKIRSSSLSSFSIGRRNLEIPCTGSKVASSLWVIKHVVM
jgi:hypothetical protein